jgi:hypothetical protein
VRVVQALGDSAGDGTAAAKVNAIKRSVIVRCMIVKWELKLENKFWERIEVEIGHLMMYL